MAKKLLDKKGVAYDEHDITMGGPKRAEMLDRVPGAMTVPQVLINDMAYGGYDDVSALDRAGKLDPLLGLQ
jgi:glutaredoxin 3